MVTFIKRFLFVLTWVLACVTVFIRQYNFFIEFCDWFDVCLGHKNIIHITRQRPTIICTKFVFSYQYSGGWMRTVCVRYIPPQYIEFIQWDFSFQVFCSVVSYFHPCRSLPTFTPITHLPLAHLSHIIHIDHLLLHCVRVLILPSIFVLIFVTQKQNLHRDFNFATVHIVNVNRFDREIWFSHTIRHGPSTTLIWAIDFLVIIYFVTLAMVTRCLCTRPLGQRISCVRDEATNLFIHFSKYKWNHSTNFNLYFFWFRNSRA